MKQLIIYSAILAFRMPVFIIRNYSLNVENGKRILIAATGSVRGLMKHLHNQRDVLILYPYKQ